MYYNLFLASKDVSYVTLTYL